MRHTVISNLAGYVQACRNCIKTGNLEAAEAHEAEVRRIEDAYLPSGSGINEGCHVKIMSSNENHIEISFTFDHIRNDSYYKTTRHLAVIEPSLVYGFTVDIQGKDYNGVKAYLLETFTEALERELE